MTSLSRNLAVNIWWSPGITFNDTNCQGKIVALATFDYNNHKLVDNGKGDNLISSQIKVNLVISSLLMVKCYGKQLDFDLSGADHSSF